MTVPQVSKRMKPTAPRALRFEVEVLRDCSIPVGCDGAELAADVYLPIGGTPCPALVTLLPYQKDGLAGILGSATYHYFASRGYACVLVDFRGLGGSSGMPRPPFDPGEAEDGVAAVEWAAEQPWCDGAVAMWGASYGAITSLRTAAQRPPSLKAVIAVVGHVDHELDFVHPDGIRGGLSSLGVWSLLALSQQLWPPLHQDRDGRWLKRWRRRLDAATPAVIDLVRRGAGDPAWRACAIDVSRVEVPTFCVGGWRDLFCRGTVKIYEELAGTKKLLMGPWMHALPDESPSEPVDFGSMAMRWWDRWLRDIPNGIEEEPPVTVYVQGRGTWHELDSWPPDTECETLRACVDGSLAAMPVDRGGERSRTVDATVGVQGGLWGVPNRGEGLPADQHEDDARSVTFTTEALADALELIGSPKLTLSLGRVHEGPRTIVAKLAEVDADGRSTLVTTGACALPDTASGDLTVDLELYPTSYEVAAGTRLRISIAGGDFPRLWPDARGGVLTVRCAGTSLRLPAHASTGDAIALVSPDGPHTNALLDRAEPVYTVTRDQINDAATVVVGETIGARTPDGEGRLEFTNRVAATVAADRPESARLEGHSTMATSGPNGHIVVETEILLHHELTVASGTVTWNGQRIFSRQWTA